MSVFSTVLHDVTSLFTHFTQANLDKLVGDVNSGIQVAESDIAAAATFIVTNGPTYVEDAQLLIATLAAFTGHLTIPVTVISALESTVGDMQQFISVANSVKSNVAHGLDLFAAMGAVDDQSRVALGYKMHQSLINATALARVSLATATKKK